MHAFAVVLRARYFVVASLALLAFAAMLAAHARYQPAPQLMPIRCAPAGVAVEAEPPPSTPPLIVAPASTHGTCTEPDFDGDGTIDRVEAEPDSCGTGGCVYRAYLVRPAGDRFVGTIEGRCSFTLERTHRKLADVVTTWRLGATDLIEVRYRFDGRRYREISSLAVATIPK